jgi:hypothetical protein
MKIVKPQTKKAAEAVEAIKELENKVGVKVQTGLRAGAGGKDDGGDLVHPMYGVPTGPAT